LVTSTFGCQALLRYSGVREYWIVDPENKGVTAYRFHVGAIQTYTYKNADTVPVGIFPDMKIMLEQVFAA